MPIPNTEAELTRIFADLGASSPEQWASSQIREGIPQLLRFLFLKGAWDAIPADGDTSWIDSEINYSRSRLDAPYAGLGLALSRCREKGVSDDDLTEIARCLQAQMLFSIGYLMDAPDQLPPPLDDVAWGLFQIDDEGSPVGKQVAGLHESVLALDPTGREMRPKNAR
jgi:hypothetical protein